MKRPIKHFILAAIAVWMTLSFSSCEKADSENNGEYSSEQLALVKLCYSCVGKSTMEVCEMLEIDGYICDEIDQHDDITIYEYSKEKQGFDHTIAFVTNNDVVRAMGYVNTFEYGFNCENLKQQFVDATKDVADVITPISFQGGVEGVLGDGTNIETIFNTLAGYINGISGIELQNNGMGGEQIETGYRLTDDKYASVGYCELSNRYHFYEDAHGRRTEYVGPYYNILFMDIDYANNYYK